VRAVPQGDFRGSITRTRTPMRTRTLAKLSSRHLHLKNLAF